MFGKCPTEVFLSTPDQGKIQEFKRELPAWEAAGGDQPGEAREKMISETVYLYTVCA